MYSNHDHCIEVCNSLLRGELSAIETYDQAVDRYEAEPIAADLHRIRLEHLHSVARLADNIRSMGGTPEHHSGAWGIFTKAVQGTANLFGAQSAVESLRQGELKGQHDYEQALEDEDVMPPCKDMIRQELLPQIKRHLSELMELEQAV